jgi:hypothetical protein
MQAPFEHGSDREGGDKVTGSSGHGFVPSSRRARQNPMGRISLTSLKSRLSDRIDRAARGTDIPAGIDRGEAIAPPTGSRDRGRMRRRLRELRRLREALLLELGALALEAHRHGRDDTPVIKRKAADAASVDAEARAIAEALGAAAGLDTIVATGIAGPCPTCGTLTSTAARFCSTCGTALDGRPGAAPRAARDASEEQRADGPQTADPDAPAITDADQIAGTPADHSTEATAELPANAGETPPSPNGDGTSPDESELEASGSER